MNEVWVVTGEYCNGSENGETFWLEGVFSSRKKADIARASAEDRYHEEHPSKVILNRPEYGYHENRGEWDVAFDSYLQPVR